MKDASKGVRYADVCVICELRPEHCTGHTSITEWRGKRYAAVMKAVPENTIKRIRA